MGSATRRRENSASTAEGEIDADAVAVEEDEVAVAAASAAVELAVDDELTEHGGPASGDVAEAVAEAMGVADEESKGGMAVAAAAGGAAIRWGWGALKAAEPETRGAE